MVDVVLKMTLGLFVKKARSLLCEKLKDGGLNAQQLRRLIMSNLQDIQTKLAGQARSSLLTSASNLQEGLRLLDALVLDEPNTPTISRPDDDNIVEDNPDGAKKLERDLGKRFDASTLDVRSFCVNSVGHLILKDPSNHCEVEPPFLLKIITSESEVKSFSQMSFLHGQIPLAIDSNDNVYYLSTFGDSFYTDSPTFLSAPSCELIALDSNGLSKDSYEFGECVGMFSFNAMNSTPCGFAVAIRREGSSVHEVTLFENDEGRIKKTSSFQTQLWNFTLITVTSKYQVVAAEKSGHYVRVYEKDGQMIREFELYGGDNESCVSVAFNHLTGEVIFITLVRRCYFLSTYIAETGERRRKIRLSLFGDDEEVHLTSHCKGPIAIVSPQLVLYLQ